MLGIRRIGWYVKRGDEKIGGSCREDCRARKNYRVLKEPSRAKIDKSCVLADHARISCQMLAFRMSFRIPAASCLPVSDDQHCAPVVIEREASDNDQVSHRIG